jgi:hypothetical protein
VLQFHFDVEVPGRVCTRARLLDHLLEES